MASSRPGERKGRSVPLDGLTVKGEPVPLLWPLILVAIAGGVAVIVARANRELAEGTLDSTVADL